VKAEIKAELRGKTHPSGKISGLNENICTFFLATEAYQVAP
jgi:hypothetical protein